MKPVFVDTSAVLALLVPSDVAHQRAKKAFSRLQSLEAPLVTTSYVLVELYALIGRRFGLHAVEMFRLDMEPLFAVAWVDRELHDAGLDLLQQRSTRRLSLVDTVSFAYMQQQQLTQAFAFDRHFELEGFELM